MTRTQLYIALLFAALVALVVSHPALTQAQGPATRRAELVNGREAVPQEVLVRFRESPRPDQLADIRGLADADSISRVGRSGLQRVRSRSLTAAALLQRLANHPDVLYAEPNYLVHAFTDPNEPAFAQLWGLRNTGQAINGFAGVAGADIHATPAWDVSLGSTSQVVAVVDTGIDYTHPDLVANMWSAPTAFHVTIEGATITCAAGTHGFNVLTKTCNPQDDHEHGTHVSGTIGAAGNNALGVVGVNWIARLMGIKFLDANGSGTVADAIDGIDFAIQVKQIFAPTAGANVRVLSASWGETDFSQALLDEINAANDADMLFVAAAGNSSVSNDILPTYPASYDAPNIISVAATTNTDDLAWFSNYGASTVHLAAPGEDILSTTPGNSYAYLSGTSMATPHVSGAAALVLSQCTLDTAGLKDTLLSTVETVPGLAGTSLTGGRLDVNSAIRSCYAPPGAPALSAVAGDSTVTVSWSGGAGALSFGVRRSLTPGGPYTLIATVKGHSYTDTTVVNDTTYYYVVSGRNTLGDSPDSNEAAAAPKVASDLIVSALTVPSMAGAGSAATLSSTIRNQGPGTARPTTTRFYLSRNATIDGNSILLDGVQAVPSILPNTLSTASVVVDIPANTAAGNFYIVAKADADDAEAETQESNNTTARFLTIGPDLVVSSLTAPVSAAPGTAIAVSETVKNQGGGAAGATTTRFYLSSDTQIDAADLLLEGSRSVPNLAAGATSSGSTSVAIPSTVVNGSYYLIARADADGVVSETQESNNNSVKALQVGGDLIVSSMTAPSTAGAGSGIIVGDTTTNQGAGAVGASVTRFYLSTKILFDGSATLLPGSRAVPDLGAGVSNSGSTTVAIPSTVATGGYYLIARADADGAVQETQETNNYAARYITIGGDLVVPALTVPATAGAGSVIAIGDTTKNQGAGSVGASTTRFYLSANATLDSSDTLLSGGRVVPGLGPGVSSAGTTNVVIPANTPSGSYYVIAKADADGVVAEVEEGNNTAVRAIRFGGDLVVSALTVPARGSAGASIVVTDTTANQGAGGAGASNTRFYFSKDATIDASDTLLAGGRAVPDLAAGASSSGSATITLPSPLAAGAYYVIAKADGDNVVDESQETNNATARPITVGPDLSVGNPSVTFTIAAGATVPVTDVVQNVGGDPAGASTTRFYLSANVLFDAGDVLLAGSRAVPALAAGASSSGTSMVTIPAGTPAGYYYLFALADADGAVTEAVETNNAAARGIQITP